MTTQRERMAAIRARRREAKQCLDCSAPIEPRVYLGKRISYYCSKCRAERRAHRELMRKTAKTL
jgi:formamidopyrimidine-DNA glycosylase